MNRDLRTIEQLEELRDNLDRIIKEKKYRKDRYWKNKSKENMQSRIYRQKKKLEKMEREYKDKYE